MNEIDLLNKIQEAGIAEAGKIMFAMTQGMTRCLLKAKEKNNERNKHT